MVSRKLVSTCQQLEKTWSRVVRVLPAKVGSRRPVRPWLRRRLCPSALLSQVEPHRAAVQGLDTFRRHVAGVPCRGSLGSKGKTASRPPPIPHDKMTEGGKPPALSRPSSSLTEEGRTHGTATHGFPLRRGFSNPRPPWKLWRSLSLYNLWPRSPFCNLGCTRREFVGL